MENVDQPEQFIWDEQHLYTLLLCSLLYRLYAEIDASHT